MHTNQSEYRQAMRAGFITCAAVACIAEGAFTALIIGGHTKQSITGSCLFLALAIAAIIAAVHCRLELKADVFPPTVVFVPENTARPLQKVDVHFVVEDDGHLELAKRWVPDPTLLTWRDPPSPAE